MIAKDYAKEIYETFLMFSANTTIEDRHITAIQCCHYLIRSNLKTCIEYDNNNNLEFSERNYWIDIQSEINKIDFETKKQLMIL